MRQYRPADSNRSSTTLSYTTLSFRNRFVQIVFIVYYTVCSV